MPSEFDWKTYPETDVLIEQHIEEACAANEDIRAFSTRISALTATSFKEWVESITLSGALLYELERLGFVLQKTFYGQKLFVHPRGSFPALRVFPGPVPVVRALTLKVESLSVFRFLSGYYGEVDGTPGSNYSRIMLSDRGGILLFAAEKNGDVWMPEDLDSEGLMDLEQAHSLMNQRRRFFEAGEDGWKYTERLMDRVTSLVGRDRCASLFLEYERRYWEARNSTARFLKARQDTMGLGWGNHDHHAFRSERASVTRFIRLMQTMGFRLRERFVSSLGTGRNLYGVQILEHSGIGALINVHVDLREEEKDFDFAARPLPVIRPAGDVTLWTGMYGESIFEAGLYHLGAKYDYWSLKELLNGVRIEVREPDSESPFLLRAAVHPENWFSTRLRQERLVANGSISPEEARKLSLEGSLGSFLECVHRVDGFKGFKSSP